MSFRSDYGFRPYVSVATRRLQARKAAKKMAGKGRTLTPVQIDGRLIARTFWGQAWCKNLESYSDYANRLPRGRTYVRNGSVIDLQITAGAVTALVQGSSLYTLTVKIHPLTAKRWDAFKERCAGRVTNLLDLLQGRLSKEILADLTARGTGLFPAPAEINLGCSCPDWADMCKHVAAVLYGVGARLDHDPALFFTLRGVDLQELVTAASTAATTDLTSDAPSDTALAGANLAEIFGVDLDVAVLPAAPVVAPVPVAASPQRGRRPAKTAALPSAERSPKSQHLSRTARASAAAPASSNPLPRAAKKTLKKTLKKRARH
jgi:uncharacterized Zn finger protein